MIVVYIKVLAGLFVIEDVFCYCRSVFITNAWRISELEIDRYGFMDLFVMEDSWEIDKINAFVVK